MNYLRQIAGAFLGWALLCSCAYGSGHTGLEPWKEMPQSVLGNDHANVMHYARPIRTLDDCVVSVKSASTLGCEGDSSSFEEIVRLWCQGHRDPVEQMWYWKDDRISRTLIMMLVLSEREDDRIDWFLHECNRFEPKERELRREEIMWIASDRDKYAGMVKSLVKKVYELKKADLETECREDKMSDEEGSDVQKNDDRIERNREPVNTVMTSLLCTVCFLVFCASLGCLIKRSHPGNGLRKS